MRIRPYIITGENGEGSGSRIGEIKEKSLISPTKEQMWVKTQELQGILRSQ